jgi:hypothetical protein
MLPQRQHCITESLKTVAKKGGQEEQKSLEGMYLEDGCLSMESGIATLTLWMSTEIHRHLFWRTLRALGFRQLALSRPILGLSHLVKVSM